MFESPHATIFVEYQPFNGGAFFISRTIVVGFCDFDDSILSGK